MSTAGQVTGEDSPAPEAPLVPRGRGRPRKPSRRKREAAGELVDEVSPRKRCKKSSSSSSSDSEDKGQTRRGRGRGRRRPRTRSEPLVGGVLKDEEEIGRLESVDGASISKTAVLGMENGHSSSSIPADGGSRFNDSKSLLPGTKLYDSEDPLTELSGRGEGAGQEGQGTESSAMETAQQDPNKDLAQTPQSHDTSAARQRAGSVSGILKHVSQYDTPTSEVKSSGGRRVQFASKPDYREPEKGEESVHTPRQGKIIFKACFSHSLSCTPKAANTVKLQDSFV